MKGPMLICFVSFERINTEENTFSFVTTPATNIPCTVHFGDLHDVPQRCKTCQLAEFRVLNLRVLKFETRLESTVKLWFSNDIEIKLATSLPMWYICDLTYLSLYELRIFRHRLRVLVNDKKNYF